MAPETTRLSDTIVSGIKTEARLDADPPGFWVTWVDWDSDFRRNLKLKDLIVAVNGQSLAPFLRPGHTDKGVGQYSEYKYWEEIGAKHGQEVTLSVIRDDQPVTVRGKLHAEYLYFDKTERQAMASGGPDRMASDGFGEPWTAWHEKILSRLSFILTRGWTQKGFVSRSELAQHLEHKARIDYLLKKYPGRFAQVMRDDWERVLENLKGTKIDLTPANLEYRAIGEKRVQISKEQAAKAWETFRKELASDAIPPFPAPSVFERREVAGKIVELPTITQRNILNDLGKVFAAIGSPSDGYYFVMLDTKDIYRFYQTMFRYKSQVNPRLQERYRYVGRVQNDPQMFTVDGRPATGLTIQVLGVMAGDDELFVDLRQDPPRFAGEALLSRFLESPRDDSSPKSVIEAMIQAIKIGDEKTWRSLFADWRITTGSGGRLALDTSYALNPEAHLSDWERSRQLVTGEVYEARVEKVERVRCILTKDTQNALPYLEEVTVWVDHYGLFDGEYRRFQSVNVNREWVLQRVDGGPWKIASVQNL